MTREHRRARRDIMAPKPHKRPVRTQQKLVGAAPTLDSSGWRRAIATGRSGPLNMVGRRHVALRTPAEMIYEDDAAVIVLAARLHTTLLSRRGMGLAACQVGLPFNMVALADGQTMLNVSVQPVGSAVEVAMEGCLTLPGRWYAIERYLRVNVIGRPLGASEAIKLAVVNLDARMWQHEADHLAGRLISELGPEIAPTSSLVPLPTGAPERLASNAAGLAGPTL